MITIHPMFRSEAEALEASRVTERAQRQARGYRYPQSIDELSADRVSRFTGGLLMNERVHGYAERPWRQGPDVATCTCAVCTWRREHREASET